MRWKTTRTSLVWIPVIIFIVAGIAAAAATLVWVCSSIISGHVVAAREWLGAFLALAILGGLLSFSGFGYLAGLLPDSWLSNVVTMIAALSCVALGGAVFIFVLQGMSRLSTGQQGALIVLATYVGCFFVFSMAARERLTKEHNQAKLKAGDWTRLVAKLSEDTDRNTLLDLYNQGSALREKYGSFIHPDFSETFKKITRLVERDG